MKVRYGMFLTFFALPFGLRAEVSVPRVFGDNMVLQREKPVPIWGQAAEGEEVTVTFGAQTKTAKAGGDGHWRVTLDPLRASSTPADLTIRGRKTVTLKNVVVGEVWLCSGQSNMEKPLGEQFGQKPTFHFQEELKAANFPLIRLFKVKTAPAAAPATEVEAAWTVCRPATLDATRFSAVGYFFGRKIHTQLDVPVGLIDSTWGGTRIEPWTPQSSFAAVVGQLGAKVLGSDQGVLFNGMIAPLAPLALRGALWYQGEANVADNRDSVGYADKMAALVLGWRQVWHDEFSFYYVQIAPHLYHAGLPPPAFPAEAEPLLWEAQTSARQLPRTGMVVTTDLVDDLTDIHPRDKKSVGERLARWALAQDYGRREVVFSGPLFKKMDVQGNRARISFDYVDGGLASKDGKPLSWFVIAGADGQFFPGHAIIAGEQVIVTSPRVAEPQVVRFGWDESAQPNLINQAGLPAAPFRSDATPWTPPTN